MRDEKNILETSLFNTLEFIFFSKKFSFDFNAIRFHLRLQHTTETGSFLRLKDLKIKELRPLPNPPRKGRGKDCEW
jgi:hypothetical protein